MGMLVQLFMTMAHIQEEVSLFSECTSVEASHCVCRCSYPCVSCLCPLLYTGSSVLQINESPVCSLDKVPQALACDWLLACLQVTTVLQDPPINNQLDVIDSSNQTGQSCFSFLWGMCSFLQSFQVMRDWWCFSYFLTCFFMCVLWSNRVMLIISNIPFLFFFGYI